MKNILLLLVLLNFTYNAWAQSFSTNKFSKSSDYYERIDLYDDKGNSIISVAPRFYKQKTLKHWVKPIKVDGRTYFIKRGKNGSESVYSESGEHVALISRKNTTIHLVEENRKYSFKPHIKFSNLNFLECRNSEGILVSTTSFSSDRTLTYSHHNGEHPNLLLMSLCTHQYQELLLGERGKLSSLNNILINSALLSICE